MIATRKIQTLISIIHDPRKIKTYITIIHDTRASICGVGMEL